jgi:hypothetical protein
MNVHTTIILIIFIVCITMICLRLGELENFINTDVIDNITPPNKTFSKLYNIDTQIIDNSANLGWKKFWRENYSKQDSNLDEVFKPSDYSHRIKPLLYDGIKDITKCPLL